MRKLKKALAVILAATLACSMSLAAFADEKDPTGANEPTTTEGEQTPGGDNQGDAGGEDGNAETATDYDHPLTVTGLETGDVAHFYKVVEWVGEAQGNVTGWKAASGFESVLTEAKLREILVGTPADDTVDPPIAAVPPAGISSELAGQLAKLATGTSTDVTVGADKKAELNNASSGLWMAIITPVNPDTVYNPVFVAADYNKEKSGDWAVTEVATYSDEAAAKKSTVTLTKTASTDEDAWDDKNWTTTAIGDTVSYTVTTKIPGYGKIYTNPVFKITDKLTDLKLQETTVELTKPEGLKKGADYTVTTTAAGYTIEFSADYLKTVKTPTDVEVKYDAIVTTTAPKHVNTEKNEVSTEFSHNPSDENDHGFKKDTTQHYTFTIDAEGLGSTTTQEGKKTSEIVKVGVDGQGKPITETKEYSEITTSEFWEGPLEKAKFKLYTDSNATTEYIPKKADGTAGTALVIESGTDGRMTIAGLDAGTYYLQESEAPVGFVRDTTIHKIEIIAETEDVDVTEYTVDGVDWYLEETEVKGEKSYTYKTPVLKSYTVKIDDKETAVYSFTNKGTDAEIIWTETPPVEHPFDIINTKGTELPATGGTGTKMFYIIGSILVLGAGIILVTRRRMSMN